jgi:dihydroorotate dehydrogenase electron transfer subunit
VRQFEAEILENRPVAEAWRELVIDWDPAAGEPRAGQFFMVRVSTFSDPLLRRPLAFSSFRRAFSSFRRAQLDDGARASDGKARASAIYQIRGGATRLLSELATGSRIDVIGPLGKAFPEPAEGETALLAGGGIGLGPLLFMDDILSGGDAAKARRLVLGFRSSSLLPSIDLPEGTVVCTDDGSSGFKGSPVDWLSRNARKATEDGLVRVYGCGPAPMLAALAGLSAELGWPASLSAEQWMACGVGACMGCALPRADGLGYLRACADGPVFEAGDVDWKAGR